MSIQVIQPYNGTDNRQIYDSGVTKNPDMIPVENMLDYVNIVGQEMPMGNGNSMIRGTLARPITVTSNKTRKSYTHPVGTPVRGFRTHGSFTLHLPPLADGALGTPEDVPYEGSLRRRRNRSRKQTRKQTRKQRRLYV